MQQSLVELYLLDLTVIYQHDFVFLQQLAIHLRTTIHTKKTRLRGGALMLNFIKSIRRINAIWNITEDNSFTDAGIIYRPDVGFCLVIKQGFNIMIGKRDDEKIPIHCGTLVYVLESNEKTFQDSIFYEQQISDHCQGSFLRNLYSKVPVSLNCR
ncbi:unnamed protein product [Rotaria sp. Silwood1]|nr:unnamed protein product [Rotaria sp. Silwood1]CAF1131768.1 unnamed protein product [Rotaria sp. Silwood1]CAF3446114.1 unnamed protein product [Rotaria sp. Silwood1]